MEYPYVQFIAPLVGRGYIRFVNIRPGRSGAWICDECCERVTPGKQERHARRHK